MPELPEVETIRRGLQKQIVGKTIKKIIIKKPNLVKQSMASFQRELVGGKIIKLDRIGKLLIISYWSSVNNLKKSSTSPQIQYKDKKYLLIHLKMTGQLIYCNQNNFIAGGHANSKKEEEEFQHGRTEEFCHPGKYTHIIFKLEDSHENKTSLSRGKASTSKLFFNDLRQFGSLKVVDSKELKKIKSRYGIEPGRPNFTFQNFQKALGLDKNNKKPRRANIKATLLNQSIISGLGNIYVDESLFAAKIYPERATNTLTKQEQKQLFNHIQRIIKLALKYNGTTFSDFVDNKGRRGNFKQMLKVYGRAGKICIRCKKVEARPLPKIQKIKVAGRGTSFCKICQK